VQPLRRVARQGQGSPVGVRRFVEPLDAEQQLCPYCFERGVAGERADVFELGQSLVSSVPLGNGYGPVDSHYGAVIDGEQYVVPADHRFPVGVMPSLGQGMAGRDGGLGGVKVGPGRGPAQGCAEQGHPFRDRGTVPQGAVLVSEEDDLASIIEAGIVP
jgi:hypothetical protein